MARLLYGLLTGFFASLPMSFGYWLADALTELHFRAFPSRRHAVLANLAVILPHASRRDRLRVCRSMMRSYNRMMFEFFRLPHLERDELLSAVEVVGREHFERAVANGRGVLLCSSHIGNWELAAVVLTSWGHTLHAVAGVQLSRWLTGAIRETKSEQAIQTVSPDDGFRKLWRALERNDLVALMVDGDIYSHGAPVSFFGREIPWPAGPGALAQRTGAMVLSGYCERVRPGRFRIVMEPAYDPADFAGAAELNAAVAARSAGHIRDHVDQWCIFRPLWEAPPVPAAASAPAGRHVEA